MNTSGSRWKMVAWVGGAVVVVIIIVVIVMIGNNGASSAGGANNATSSAGPSSTVTTVTNSAPGGNGTAAAVAPQTSAQNEQSNIPALPGPAITIDLITPISGNAWKIGGANPIAWSNAANITGEIDLINAASKAFVGVILSETGPNQTSYSWNARSIYLARYSANQVDVVPGTYSIRIHFDGNGLGDLVSGPITITN